MEMGRTTKTTMPKPEPQLRPIYDTQFVASRYGVSRRTVRRWIQRGRIHASKGPGTSWMVTEQELERLQEA